ncbi:MAG: VOC family protein [Gammaproteobacteria bacterium]|nr:VOC family protein [Gammaproteobacteria bacterium]
MNLKANQHPLLTSGLKQIGNVHHVAYRCRDAEQTRWFYEEILGLPLAAALVFDHIPGFGGNLGEPAKEEYMHLFFELGDGNFIAFFDHPDTAMESGFERKHSFDMHLALEVESHEAMLVWQEHISRSGKTSLGPVDHGFIQSIYMYDPNGIQVEITCKTPECERILAADASQASDKMIAWTQKTRAQKIKKFGQEVIDKRGR